MAGSYRHVTSSKTGKLVAPTDSIGGVENLGDAYEAIEEMYGMIWWLASQWDHDLDQLKGVGPYDVAASVAQFVEEARQNYREGLEVSPGTDGVYE